MKRFQLFAIDDVRICLNGSYRAAAARQKGFGGHVKEIFTLPGPDTSVYNYFCNSMDITQYIGSKCGGFIQKNRLSSGNISFPNWISSQNVGR